MRDRGVLSLLEGCVESSSVSFSPALVLLIMLWWLEGFPLDQVAHLVSVQFFISLLKSCFLIRA